MSATVAVLFVLSGSNSSVLADVFAVLLKVHRLFHCISLFGKQTLQNRHRKSRHIAFRASSVQSFRIALSWNQ